MASKSDALRPSEGSSTITGPSPCARTSIPPSPFWFAMTVLVGCDASRGAASALAATTIVIAQAAISRRDRFIVRLSQLPACRLVADRQRPCKASLTAEPGIVPTSFEHGTAHAIRNIGAPPRPDLSPLFIPSCGWHLLVKVAPHGGAAPTA